MKFVYICVITFSYKKSITKIAQMKNLILSLVVLIYFSTAYIQTINPEGILNRLVGLDLSTFYFKLFKGKCSRISSCQILNIYLNKSPNNLVSGVIIQIIRIM